MPGNLGIFPKLLRESDGSLFFMYTKFLKCLAIWEISQILKVYHSQIPIGIWKNFPNTWESGEFSKFHRESYGSLFFKYRKFLKCVAI